MAGLNKVLLIGNLTRDPEIRYSKSGTAVANFSIATNESWRDQQGQKQERVEFHSLVSFGKQAEVLGKYLVKGSQVYIDGKLQTRQYEKDGQTHYATEIIVQEFTFLGGGQQSNGGGQQQGRGNKPAPWQQTGQHSQGRTQQKNNQSNGYDDGHGDIHF